jgi:hypothetical protein
MIDLKGNVSGPTQFMVFRYIFLSHTPRPFVTALHHVLVSCLRAIRDHFFQSLPVRCLAVLTEIYVIPRKNRHVFVVSFSAINIYLTFLDRLQLPCTVR